MELVGLLRGEYLLQKEWIELIRSAYWSTKGKDAKGKTHNILVRTGVSPITPISIIFPEQHLNEMLGMVKPNGSHDHIFDKSSKARSLKYMMQKALSLKSLPSSWEEYKHPITNMMKLQHQAFHPIGIKEDNRDKNNIEML